MNGTDVAKESADMVLTDDNFATIEAAVEEGRCVYDNLRKFIMWTLPTNLGEGLSIIAAIFAGLTLPILPVQILWINMTTAVFLGLMLAFETREPNLMARPPHPPDMPVMTKRVVARTVYIGLLMTAGVFALFHYELNSGASIAEARAATVSVIVAIEMFYLFNCRSFSRSFVDIGLFSNPLIWAGSAAMAALQLLFVYWAPMNTYFRSAPLNWDSWVRILVIAAGISIIVGIEKKAWAGPGGAGAGKTLP
jgi:magnesium-transporting ATPase (P-type)